MNAALPVTAESRSVVPALTAADIRAHVQRIQEVMKAVMKKDTHYGQIPGTNKPTLYKAGSEVLLTTFRIACEPDVEDLSTSDEIRYRVRCRGVHQQTGIVIGVGVGECSSSEDKYRWRRALCDEEFDETPPDRRREKWMRGESGTYQIKQVRTNPADVANTILKMAKKRGQIDMTLTALAASDIFTQDLEEEESGGGEQQQRPAQTKAGTSAPKSTGQTKGVATVKQIGLVKGRLDAAGIREIDFLAAFELTQIEHLPFGKVNDALSWIQSNAP